MNIFLDNVNLMSTTGPNHFGNKLKKNLELLGHSFSFDKKFDLQLSFIEENNRIPNIPLVQRLDGIYFNNRQDYLLQNKKIFQTYKSASGVIFQTQFNKDLIYNYFGPHEKYTIIRNGADLQHIDGIRPLRSPLVERANKIWCCASNWRPHKRLSENVKYFLKNSDPRDHLLVAGDVEESARSADSRVHYLGNIRIEDLISVYKVSDYFIHLAWLDHCPNVVVDALACGCQIICSSSGGTKEVAGIDAVVIEEEKWNFEPIDLYSPPKIDINNKTDNVGGCNIDMKYVASQYSVFLEKILNENN